MGTIEEIKELIEELLEKNDENKISIATSIKKLYSAYRKEKRKEGRLSEYTIKELVTVLRKNYESLKQYAPINETLEMIVEDYNTLSEVVNDDKKEIYKREIFTIHRRILGNPGASIEGMSLDYLKKVIENKIDVEHGINKDDIINIIDQVSKGVIYDFEEYHKFFDDTIIPIVEADIDNSEKKLNNPEVIDILIEVAKSYKRNGDYEKGKELCEKGLKLEQFKETEQYSELQREYDKMHDGIKSIEKNFEGKVDISGVKSLEEFIATIKIHIAVGEQEEYTPPKKKPIYKPDMDKNPEKDPEKDPDKDPTDDTKTPHDPLTLEEKCTAIYNFLLELRKQKHDVKFANLRKGKKGTTWKNYEMIEVDGAEFTIFENFIEDAAALYMIKNENIEKIDECLKKGEVREEPGVEYANHSNSDLETYEKRLMNKYRILMGLEPVKKDYKRYKTTTNIKKTQKSENIEEKEEQPSVNSVKDSEDIKEKVKIEEIDFENLSDEELLALTEELDKGIEELEEENKELQEEAERLEKEKRRKALIEEAKAKRAAMNAKKTENSQLKQKVKELKEEPNKKTSNTHTQE